MKKLLSAFLSVILVLSLLSTAAWADETPSEADQQAADHVAELIDAIYVQLLFSAR